MDYIFNNLKSRRYNVAYEIIWSKELVFFDRKGTRCDSLFSKYGGQVEPASQGKECFNFIIICLCIDRLIIQRKCSKWTVLKCSKLSAKQGDS
jgi:hypothetical protein